MIARIIAVLFLSFIGISSIFFFLMALAIWCGTVLLLLFVALLLRPSLAALAVCGVAVRATGETDIIPAGSLDDEPGIQPQARIFTASRSAALGNSFLRVSLRQPLA